MMSRRSMLGSLLGSLSGGLLANQGVLAEDAISAKSAGYRLPLESDPHERTFMQWPAIKSIYGSKDDLDAVREKIALIASTIARFEPVVLLARPEQAEDAKHWVKGNVEDLATCRSRPLVQGQWTHIRCE